MPLPTSISRLFSFTGFQQGQGDNSFPGTDIDADLDQTNGVLNSLLSTVAAVIRPDGKIANGAVGRGALGADVLLGVGPSKPWTISQAYLGGVDTVTRANKVFLCVVSNTGVDPALDVSGAYWLQTADLSQSVVVADGSIGANAFADKSLTEPKFADASVSGRALQGGAVGRTNAAVGLGVVPVGAQMSYAGVQLPAGWLWCAGQSLSRVAYADLFAALSLTITATITTSSKSLSGLSRTLGGVGLRNAAVEGPGIPQGTVLVNDAAGSETLSNNATASGSVTLRLMPYGRGDGSTTFTLPDCRGRVAFGRDDMGGTAAGRLVKTLIGTSLASTGGAEGFTLLNANLPSAMPGGVVTVSYPPHLYAIRAANPGASTGAGSATVSDLWQGITTSPTQAPNPEQFAVNNTNPGGDQPVNLIAPALVSNTIIFAGV